MSRKWLRLVACTSLVAYLVANTHLNLALAAYVAAPPRLPATETTDSASEAPVTASRCKHCAQRVAATKSEQPTKSCQQQHDQSCPGCPDCPFGPGCPCCPKGPQGCPTPGGCAMCSVAKAPCLEQIPSVEGTASPTFELVCEFSHFYLQPLCDGLQRPPRA